MDTEKYINLTRRCCQKYGGIDAKGDYHGCESKACPLKALECGDFMSGDYNPLGEASEICQRAELALRKEFPEAFQDELEQMRERKPVLYDLRLLHPVRPHMTKADTLDYNAQILHIRGECDEAQDAYDRWQRNLDEKSHVAFIEEMVDTAICALTLLVNATTPEQFRLAAEMVNCKNRLRQYGKAEEGGGLA